MVAVDAGIEDGDGLSGAIVPCSLCGDRPDPLCAVAELREVELILFNIENLRRGTKRVEPRPVDPHGNKREQRPGLE